MNRWRRLDLFGLLVGVVFAGISTTPSLLPRTPLDQGVITGVCFGAGYLVGVGVSAIWRRLSVSVPRRPARVAWVGVMAVGALAAIPVLAAYRETQSDLHARVGGEALTAGDVAMAVGIAALTSLLLLLLGKSTAAVHGRLSGLVGRRVSAGEAAGSGVAGSVLAGALIALGYFAVAVSGVIGLAIYMQTSYDAYNASFDPNLVEPSGEYRSTGPESPLSWERAGHEGRRILGTGPSAGDIEGVTQQPAKEPIRVYVGLDEPGDWDAHAAAAVAELDRLDARDRDVLVVAATTGTGWLDPQAIDAVEYINHGDTALVAMQYSLTESWHSVLFHGDAFRQSTRALATAVHDWWSTLPADHRPRLYLYGLSLGSRAVQESFPDAEAMLAYGDGVVLAGTPNGTALNADLTALRDPGSPVVVPVVENGRRYRWFADALDIEETSGTWDQPRVSFLQHGTDPIVWVGLSMLWSRPEWLEAGERSNDVHRDMRWFPVVSAVQGFFDITEDLSGPDGIGHRYGAATLEAWIVVAGDGGLEPDVLDGVRQRVIGNDLPTGDGA